MKVTKQPTAFKLFWVTLFLLGSVSRCWALGSIAWSRFVGGPVPYGDHSLGCATGRDTDGTSFIVSGYNFWEEHGWQYFDSHVKIMTFSPSTGITCAETTVGPHDHSTIWYAENSRQGAVAADTSGSVYLARIDLSPQGDWQIHVSRHNASLAPTLDDLVSTGTGAKWPRALAIDAERNIYLAGSADSANFHPDWRYTTSTAPIRAFATSSDGFVAKWNSAGELQWWTFLGGSDAQGGLGMDAAHGVAVDGVGNVFAVGSTTSYDFPTTGTYADRQYDELWNASNAFVTKLDSTSGTIAWSTYYGVQSGAATVATDADGNAYVAGWTEKNDFNGKLLVARFDADGYVRWRSTVDGTWFDDGQAITVDQSGRVFVSGLTTSGDLPVPGGPDQTLGGLSDFFVMRFASANGNQLWGTYLGGEGYEGTTGIPTSIAADGVGGVYVAGTGVSAGFPISEGSGNCFLLKYDGLNTPYYWDGFDRQPSPDVGADWAESYPARFSIVEPGCLAYTKNLDTGLQVGVTEDDRVKCTSPDLLINPGTLVSTRVMWAMACYEGNWPEFKIEFLDAANDVCFDVTTTLDLTTYFDGVARQVVNYADFGFWEWADVAIYFTNYGTIQLWVNGNPWCDTPLALPSWSNLKLRYRMLSYSVDEENAADFYVDYIEAKQ